jgi:DNA-binding transcriptional LysR family regulator
MEADLTKLRHIAAIAEHRSFSRAAEELHLTQPALSRSIAAFEQRCGFRIFDRNRGGVVPTALGRLVIAEAESVVRAARALDLNLKLYARGEAGELSIGLGPLLASLLLPSLGKQLLQGRPQMRLRTAIGTPVRLVEDLLDDRIELIFGNSWSIEGGPDLAIAGLGSIAMRFMVRSAHPLAGASQLTFADLQRYPAAAAAEVPARGLGHDAGAIICDNFHILRDLVLETDCVWLSSPALVSDDIAEGRMTLLDVADFEPFESEISVIQRQGRTLSPAAVFLTEQVRELLAGS